MEDGEVMRMRKRVSEQQRCIEPLLIKKEKLEGQ